MSGEMNLQKNWQKRFLGVNDLCHNENKTDTIYETLLLCDTVLPTGASMKKTLFNLFLLLTFYTSLLAREALPILVEGGEPLSKNYYIDSRSPVNAVAISEDGKTIVSGSCDGSIKIWESETGKVLKEFVGDVNGCWQVKVLDTSPQIFF